MAEEEPSRTRGGPPNIGHGQIRTQNRFGRVWGAPVRTAEGKRRGGHTWWMLLAGKGPGGRIRDEWRCRWPSGRRQQRNTKGGGKWGRNRDESERRAVNEPNSSETSVSSRARYEPEIPPSLQLSSNSVRDVCADYLVESSRQSGSMTDS